MAKKPTTTTTPRPRKTAAAAAPAASSHEDHSHAAPAMASGTATISSSMDYAAHEAMYNRFMSMVKWGIIGAVVLVLFLFIAIHPMVPPPAS